MDLRQIRKTADELERDGRVKLAAASNLRLVVNNLKGAVVAPQSSPEPNPFIVTRKTKRKHRLSEEGRAAISAAAKRMHRERKKDSERQTRKRAA